MTDRRRLLLVSYFYPPTRDTGAQRPAAMAKWLAPAGVGRERADHECVRGRGRRLEAGGWSFGAGLPTGPSRQGPADLARSARGARERRVAVRLRFLLGAAARAQQGDRSRAAGGRVGAVRATGRPGRSRARALRRGPDHLAAGVRACDRAGAAAARGAVDRRRARRLDLRAAAQAVPDRSAAAPRRAARATLAGRRRRGRLRQRARRGGSALPRDRRPGGDRQRLGPRLRSERRGGGLGRGPARPGANLAALHGPLRQLRARPPSPDGGDRPPERDRPRGGGSARTRDRRPAHPRGTNALRGAPRGLGGRSTRAAEGGARRVLAGRPAEP